MDIEEIRQSPRQFVDLETVEWLSDRVMVLEMQLSEAQTQLHHAAQMEAMDKKQLAEAQARIDELTTMCEDLVCEAKDFAYKLEQKTVQLADCQAALALKDEAIDKYGHNRFCERGIVLSMFKKTERACTCYMQEALTTKPDNAALREWGARLLEECDRAVDAIDGGGIGNTDLAAALRSGEWKPEILK